MTKKFMTVQIPLIELSSDSEPSVQRPPASPDTSHGTSATRTPCRVPTVSDDDEDPETPPGYGQRLSDSSPRPPIRRSPTPPPQQQMPAPAPLPPPASRPPRGARMSVGPLPPRPLAVRDYPPGFPPRPMYERGESSRQPDYRLQHFRQMDSLSSQLRDTRHAFFELQGAQTRLVDRMGEYERTVGTLRRDVDYRAEEMSVDALRREEVLAERATELESMLTGTVMVVAVVAAILVGLVIQYFWS